MQSPVARFILALLGFAFCSSERAIFCSTPLKAARLSILLIVIFTVQT